ncbi:MAG TPA: hypothetical protein VK402_21195 [Blastococcus sp.]|nr:hypothetical protein [Blastococcus sp.]
MDDETQQPPRRERIGARAWVRTAGLVGGGLVAGGILAGTLSANAASTEDPTTSVPSYSSEEGATTGGNAPRDCPEDAAGGTPGDTGSAEQGTTTEGSSSSPTT